MTQFTDIMIDIETTGTEPDRNAILQIGAVKFNLNTKEVSSDFFDECMSMPNHRSWDEGTRQWWSKQPKSIMTDIQTRQKKPLEVMQKLQQWALPVGSLRFWSKPTHFDYMFISSYFSDLGLVNPFSYRDATDMNSYIRGMYAPQEVPQDIEKNLKHAGVAHNGLQDCLYQIKLLFAHSNNKGN